MDIYIYIYIMLVYLILNCNWWIDGLVDDHFILEIKCPYVAKDTTSAIEAIEKIMVCKILLNYNIPILNQTDYIYIKMWGILFSCHIVRLKKEKFY